MIFAIADLHFDSSGEKPMDIFGDNWEDHEEQIMENWKRLVSDDDLVLIPGDISWALRSEEAYEDLKKIDDLPGRKILLKGNHDYWWGSLKKLKDFGFESIEYLQNNSFSHEGVAIVGTRGWSDLDLAMEIDNGDMDHNEKIFNREIHRLKLSLEDMDREADKIIAILHYPPFNIDLKPNDFGEILEEYEVDICLYGHLHGDGHQYVQEANINGVEYYCVASDFINFSPKLIL